MALSVARQLCTPSGMRSAALPAVWFPYLDPGPWRWAVDIEVQPGRLEVRGVCMCIQRKMLGVINKMQESAPLHGGLLMAIGWCC